MLSLKDYSKQVDPNTNQSFVEVRSPMMKTGIDDFIKMSRGLVFFSTYFLPFLPNSAFYFLIFYIDFTIVKCFHQLVPWNSFMWIV